jgi:hypothetical protein
MMKAKRSYPRRTAAKVAAATTKTIDERRSDDRPSDDDLDASEPPSDRTDASSKTINTYPINKKIVRTKESVKSAQNMIRNAKIKEFLPIREEEKASLRHEEYVKRRAARMLHSSNKLYLSHRLTSIINYHSPQSPIECINLASQFTNSNSKIIKVTRDTRKLRIHLHYK